MPGWVGDLRGIDLYVRHPDATLRVAAELPGTKLVAADPPRIVRDGAG